MIIDVTGIELTPGNKGAECKGNGKHYDESGNLIECCCDECNYLVCCVAENPKCNECADNDCPRKTKIL